MAKRGGPDYSERVREAATRWLEAQGEWEELVKDYEVDIADLITFIRNM